MAGKFINTKYYDTQESLVNMHNKLMKQKIGAIMTTDYHISTNEFDDDNILYFIPKSDYLKRTLYIITLKNANLSPAAQKFLELAKKFSSIK